MIKTDIFRKYEFFLTHLTGGANTGTPHGTGATLILYHVTGVELIVYHVTNNYVTDATL